MTKTVEFKFDIGGEVYFVDHLKFLINKRFVCALHYNAGGELLYECVSEDTIANYIYVGDNLFCSLEEAKKFAVDEAHKSFDTALRDQTFLIEDGRRKRIDEINESYRIASKAEA